MSVDDAQYDCIHTGTFIQYKKSHSAIRKLSTGKCFQTMITIKKKTTTTATKEEKPECVELLNLY